MNRLLTSTALLGAVLCGGAAQAECGNVTLSAFSWQSSEAMTYVDQYILSNGHGCSVEVVAGDTVPTITTLIEKGHPELFPAPEDAAKGGVTSRRTAGRSTT